MTFQSDHTGRIYDTATEPQGWTAWRPEMGETKPDRLIYQRGGHGNYAFLDWDGRNHAAVLTLFKSLKIRPRWCRLDGPAELTPVAQAKYPQGKGNAGVTWTAAEKLRPWTASELLLD